MNLRFSESGLILPLLVFLAMTAAGSLWPVAVRAQSLVPPEAHISDDQTRIALARSLAVLGRIQEAVKIIRGQLDRTPDNWRLLMELAELELRQGHAKQAREQYLQAQELTDRPAQVRYALAGAMMVWGDFHGAEKIYRSRLAGHPDETETILKLAGVLAAAQRYPEAEGLYLELLLDDRAETEARLGLAGIRFLEKDYRAALAHLIELDRPPEKAAEVESLKARVLAALGRYQEAEQIWTDPGRSGTGLVEGLVRAASMRQRAGRGDLSRELAARALELDPANPEADLLAAGTDRAPSPGFISRVLDDPDRTSQGLLAWAQTFAEWGHFDPAVGCLEKALDLDPDFFPARMRLAELLAAAHRYRESLDALDALARDFPGASKILVTRARVLAWARQYSRAVAAYQELMDSLPRDPVIRVEQARVLAWAKEMDRALEAYGRLCTPPVDQLLVDALAQSGQNSGPLPYGPEKDPQEGGGVYGDYETLWSKLKDLSAGLKPEAATELKRIMIRLRPAYLIQKQARLEALAKGASFNRKFVRALSAYDRLLEFQPGNEEAAFDRAQALCALGMCDRERKAYQALLAIDPLHSLAGQGLERQRRRANPALKAAQSLWREEGRGDLSGITRWRSDLELEIPLLCRHSLTLSLNRWSDDPEDGPAEQALGFTLAGQAVFNSFVSAQGSYTRKFYDRLDDRDLFRAGLWLNLLDLVKLGGGVERAEEVYNRFGLAQGTRSDRWWLEARSQLHRRADLIARAAWLDYNDGNRGLRAGLDLGLTLTDHPRSLKLTLSGEYRDTDEKETYLYDNGVLTGIIHPYWSPQDYFSGRLTLEWNHDLSRLQFCGAKKHSYRLALSVGTDTEDNPTASLRAEWDWDFLDHWTLQAQGLLSRSREWNAEGLWLSLNYRF